MIFRPILSNLHLENQKAQNNKGFRSEWSQAPAERKRRVIAKAQGREAALS